MTVLAKVDLVTLVPVVVIYAQKPKGAKDGRVYIPVETRRYKKMIKGKLNHGINSYLLHGCCLSWGNSQQWACDSIEHQRGVIKEISL